MSKCKSILITGATSGIGYALTKRLLTEGHSVWATGRSVTILEELKHAGANIIVADLSKKEDVDDLMLLIDSLDVAIFSAGVGAFNFAHETSDEAIQSMMELNVNVPMRLTKLLLPHMIARKKGHLIFLGSQAGKVATPKASVYAASKHAIVGYTNALRMEVAPFGIHVTTVNPGPVDTPFLQSADETGNYRKSLGKHVLTVDSVVDAIIHAMKIPVREVNLPWYMTITSKLYAVMPSFVERIGYKFFTKK